MTRIFIVLYYRVVVVPYLDRPHKGPGNGENKQQQSYLGGRMDRCSL